MSFYSSPAGGAGAATTAYDLWSNAPIITGRLTVGSNSVVMREDGLCLSTTTTTDASSTVTRGNTGRYFEQTSSGTNGVVGGIRSTDGQDGGQDVNSLPWHAASMFVDRVTNMSFGFGIIGPVFGFGVIETDTDPALRHLIIGAHTSRSDTNIMILSDDTLAGSQTRVDTGVALSQLLEPGIRCLIRMLSATSAQVTIWDADDNSELYDATITDVGFGSIQNGFCFGVAPRSGAGPVKVSTYYYTVGHQMGTAG
jgi:hypothetical protein